MRARHIIELKEGVSVELLITPSMYEIARRKGLTVVIDDADNPNQVVDAYTKLIYLAALNAREAMQWDHPGTPDLEISLADFRIWAAERPKEFGDMVKVMYECLTGKSLDEILAEKKKAKGEKKKSFFKLIMAKLKKH